MANFHAADLWVAVVPDVSKVGPAMQQAGKEADKGFRDGVKDIGKSITDDLQRAKEKTKDIFSDTGKSIGDGFKGAGKKASESFSDEFKTGVKEVGKVIIAEYGPTIGEELGKAVGGAIGDALHDIPGMDHLVDRAQELAQYAQPAAQAFSGMRDAINATKAGDFGTALGSAANALRDAEPLAKALGIDISSWPTQLDTIAKDFGDTSTNVSETAKSLKSFTDQAGPAGSSMRAFGDAALAASGPIGITLALAKEIDAVFTKLNIAKFTEVPGSAIWFMHEIANGFREVGQAWQTAKDAWNALTNPPAPPSPGTPLPQPPGQAPQPPGPTGPAAPGYYIGRDGKQWPNWDRGHQAGGPIHGPGAVGKDSVLMWGAPGEHVLTADEVSAMGGHSNVYAFRSALHRNGGGSIENQPVVGEGGLVIPGTEMATKALRQGNVKFNPNLKLDLSTINKTGSHTGISYNLQKWWSQLTQGYSPTGLPGFQGGGAIGRANTAGASDLPKLNTYGAQVDTIAVSQAVQKLFGISNIGMYRAADAFPEHPSGEAADIMLGGVDNPLGYTIKDWALANAAVYDVLYCIWQQKMWYPGGKVEGMEDRGSPTQNHRDHVHIRTAGGGYPQGGQPAGAPSPAGTKSTPAPGVSGGMQPTGAGGARVTFGGGGSPGGVTTGGGAPGGGDQTGQGGGQTGDQMGQELGQGLVTGALQALGIDGSVFKSFTGKGPLDWGITKLGMGILNLGLQQVAGRQGQGGQGQGGQGGMGGLAQGALGALGVNMPGVGNVGPGGGQGGGDIHNYNGTFGGLTVNQTGVDNGPQGFNAAANSAQYAAQLDSGMLAGSAQP